MNSGRRFSKKRIDEVLLERELVPDLKTARAMILSGYVLVENEPVTKSGMVILESANVRLKQGPNDYVSRGALKLEAALDHFQVNVKAAICLDVGASTGGFTDVLLRHGAQKVFALDVGANLLDWKIRSDARVVVIENQNARELEKTQIPDSLDLIVADVSFISLAKVLPALIRIADPKTRWITLIKPQFEVERGSIQKGGIVENPVEQMAAVEFVKREGVELGLIWLGLIKSPIKGTKGNQEYLAYWKSA